MSAGRLDFLVRAYSLDLRSLALMRILVGLGFLVCRLINIPWIGEFQTDFGSYPRVCASLFPAGQTGLPYGFSLFNAVGSETGVTVLYLLAMLAALALVLGYRTRLATFCCWLLGSSIYYRCPLINPASDAEVLLCLFFGFFLPWGERWSLDSPSSPDTELPVRLVPPQAAVLGWRIQVAALYITAAFSKTSLHWGNGTATYVALRSDAWSSWLGRWIAESLAQYPDFSSSLTGFVVFLEFLLPFLLLTPVIRLQLLGLIGLVIMHAAFGMALHLEAFSPLAISCMSGFIPSACWARLGWLESRLDRLFSKSSLAVGTPSGHFKLGPASSAFVTWALIGVLWTCAMSVRIVPPAWTDRFLTPWHNFGLQQSWGMFVPPPYQGGWYLIRGRTARGDWVNLEVDGDQADSLAMPVELDQSMPTSRHVLLYQTLIMKDSKLEPLQQRIADDFRVRWEKKHPEATARLIEIEIYRFYREYDCYKDEVSPAQLTFVLKKTVP